MAAGADVKAPKIWVPHQYQSTAVKFLHERTAFNPAGRGGAGLFLDPGMGKSSIVLDSSLYVRGSSVHSCSNTTSASSSGEMRLRASPSRMK